MKKRNLLPLLMVLLLTACGAAPYDTAVTEEAADTVGAIEAPAEMAEPAEAQTASGTPTAGLSIPGEDLSEKIIYTAYAELETTDFDGSIQAVSTLLEAYNGFIESSTVTGSNLQNSGYFPYRCASYTLRFPRESYTAVTSDLSQIGNVTYLSSDAANITVQYTDTDSRLTAYKTEETRLLEILGQAETVEDMIAVESHLSDIRYEMEQLTTQLKNWDNQISYSTVSLSIQEVEVLTPVEQPTYWQEVGQALLDTVDWMGSAGKTLFKLLVAALPLVPICLILLIPLVLCRKKRRTRKNPPEPPV